MAKGCDDFFFFFLADVKYKPGVYEQLGQKQIIQYGL